MKRVEIFRSEESLCTWTEEKRLSDLGSGCDNSESLEARLEEKESTGVILSHFITQSQKT